MRCERVTFDRANRLPVKASFDWMTVSALVVVPVVMTRLPPDWLTAMPAPVCLSVSDCAALPTRPLPTSAKPTRRNVGASMVTGSASARNWASVSGCVRPVLAVTVPDTGTAVARSWASVSGCARPVSTGRPAPASTSVAAPSAPKATLMI